MDVDSIVQTGFLKKYWKSSAGDWQRFGPGFYFGPQASKAHEYPLPQMQKLPSGFHTRKMLLCKVARGKIHKTATNSTRCKAIRRKIRLRARRRAEDRRPELRRDRGVQGGGRAALCRC